MWWFFDNRTKILIPSRWTIDPYSLSKVCCHLCAFQTYVPTVCHMEIIDFIRTLVTTMFLKLEAKHVLLREGLFGFARSLNGVIGDGFIGVLLLL